MSHHLLMVDDNPDNNYSTKLFLEANGFIVDTVVSSLLAIEMIKKSGSKYAVILMDYEMPEMDGAQAGREILSINPRQQIAMYTCHDLLDVVKEAISSGMVAFFEKHMAPEALIEKLQGLCSKYDQTVKPITENINLSETEELIRSVGMVGCSLSSARMCKMIAKIAPLDHTVLIRGESGTGKELVAKALHNLSPRKNNHFVAVNCAAIPENLLESELFGHEKGAFTSAVKTHVGKFVLANRGTIFLDEIGDMPLHLQAKLLRVLQERVVEPVGSQRQESIDVRVVTASHKNLKDMVEKGLFRQDLYFRLNVLEILIAPLRERPEDIEPLVAHFSAKEAKKSGIPKTFERATIQYLKAYSWPGNVRELEHFVENHLALASGKTVKVEDLDSVLFSSKPVKSLLDLDNRHEGEKKELIRKVLAQSPSQAEAARRLGISKSRLHYYVTAFQLPA